MKKNTAFSKAMLTISDDIEIIQKSYHSRINNFFK